MTLSEFKAWFEGFTESMDGPPNAKAWKRIQARVKEISGTPVTERVYVDRYWEPYRRLYYTATCSTGSTVNDYSAGYAQNGIGHAVLMNAKAEQMTESFDSHVAMASLGRAEALSLAS